MLDSSLANPDKKSLKQKYPILAESLRKTYHFSRTQLLMNAFLTIVAVPLSKHYGLLTGVQSWATLKIVAMVYGALLLLSALWNFINVPLRRLDELAQRVGVIETQPEPSALVSAPVSTSEIERVMEQFMERYYDLNKLKPNLVASSPENVAAHYDANGIMVKGSAPSGVTFRAFVLPLSNSSQQEKVAPLEKVSLRITYVNYNDEQSSRSKVMPRGAWLSESETEIDFPPNCLPRNALIATVSGEANTVNAIRRDDSSYKGAIYTAEELRGPVFGVQLDLRAPSHVGSVKKSDYILEIIREPRFDIKLTLAAIWKSEHLRGFRDEGDAFRVRLHEIWKDAHEQVPYPPVDTNKPLFSNSFIGGLSGTNRLEPFDYAAADVRIRAIEQEQEGKLLDAIKDWDLRAAGFVKLYIGTAQHQQFVSIAPSFETGFNRTTKGFRLRMPLRRNAIPKDDPPELPYWTLYDAVNLRSEKLSSFLEQLWKKMLSS